MALQKLLSALFKISVIKQIDEPGFFLIMSLDRDEKRHSFCMILTEKREVDNEMRAPYASK